MAYVFFLCVDIIESLKFIYLFCMKPVELIKSVYCLLFILNGIYARKSIVEVCLVPCDICM